MRNRKIGLFCLLLTLLFSSMLLPAFAKEEDTATKWRDTGLSLPTGSPKVCFDATRPDILLVAAKASDAEPGGTLSYNLKTGQRTRLNDTPFTECNESNGLLFATVRGTEGALRFTAQKPAPTPVKYAPAEMARDGSLHTYGISQRRLYHSPDGGDIWQERGQLFAERVYGVAVAPADARTVYVLARVKPTNQDPIYTIYASSDAGQSWQSRYEARHPESTTLEISTALLSRNAPLGGLLLEIKNKGTGKIESNISYSADGGATFNFISNGEFSDSHRKVFFTHEGILRYSNNYSRRLWLELSLDAGKNWQPLATPPMILPLPSPNPEDYGKLTILQQAENAPGNFFFSHSNGSDDVWHSGDGGRSWQKVAANMTDLYVSPYAPHYLVGVKARKISTLPLPQADKSLTAGVAPGANYFPPTRQNISPLFKAYWEQKGGLEQFGYPRTPAFREFNPADGQVYLVQYFERNRFEFHPENRGTQYEVLLGLLGNQLIEKRRAEPPFVRTANANFPGGLYFPETGHNLRGKFKEYWERNGGLAVYGYPTSEEFMELNPDDGKTYLVQYFERNRFELHPENAGTKYEVLLGLLGNSVLREKGWL
jgi:hypothetical protein